MRLYFLTAVLTVLSSFFASAANVAETIVLPRPAEIEVVGDKSFKINEKTTLFLSGLSDADRERLTQLLSSRLPGVEIRQSRSNNQIELRLIPDSTITPEAYKIKVDKKHVVVTASAAAGLFYGVQTLAQIIDENGGEIAQLTISDAPRFP